MAGEARRRNGASLAVRLEERVDALHRAADDLARLAGDRLRDAKLSALAELAAGAGHEINNPLAVISGNAQRLLRTEGEEERAEALQAIVRQSHRISGILRDLRQFACPPKPQDGVIAAAQLIDDAVGEVRTTAEERGVRIELVSVPGDVWLTGDRQQLRHSLAAVVRNAVEAAGSDGWVRVECASAGDAARFIVEDSGPGLTAEAAEHAFDPFYSGRSAGRGRGLGLSTSWRFLRQNNGAIRYEPTPDGTSRFVITLPVAAEDEIRVERACA
jgi:C4-dicarboxylate-specific signal transduction histidine kinase